MPSPRRPARLVAALLAVALAVVAGVWGARWLISSTRAPGCEFTAGAVTEQLSPEQAANAATIAMVAVGRELPRRSVTVALATAIQESGLRNLNYGHADSLGLFQQRPSQGWGSPEQVRDPIYASNTFYDALLEVSGWADMEVTVAAQEVQRSAFPTAYADHEDEARVMASVLTGQTTAAITCRLPSPSEPGSADRVLEKATAQFGASGAVDGSGVRLDAADAERAWAIASWAVAHAQSEQIRAVSVQGYRWSREDPTVWARTDDTSAGVQIEVG